MRVAGVHGRRLLPSTAVLAAMVCLLVAAARGAPPEKAAAPATDLTRVTFIPQWIPQAQFAGYYVAHDLGFYRQHRLEVNILRGGPAWPASEMVAQGRADFGTTFLAKGIEMRARGAPLVNIAQIVQRSALMLVAKKSRGFAPPPTSMAKRSVCGAMNFASNPGPFSIIIISRCRKSPNPPP